MTNTTPTPEPSAARQFWNAQMQRHPNLHGILSILGSVVEFFTGGHFLVRLGHKVVMTGGVIAETSLLFATLWVTADYTIPAFLHRFMSADLMSVCTSLSQASFSLLPEIILASAIVATAQHWKRASANWHTKRWVWACLYSAPTLIFLVLTLYTILTFSSQGGSIAQATGAALALRCLAGYSYALLELVYARIGQPGAQAISQQDHLKTVERLHAEQERRLDQLDQQQQHLLTAMQEVQRSPSLIDVQALTEAVTKQLEARFAAPMRQRVTIMEAPHEATHPRQLAAPKKKRAVSPPAASGREAGSNILPLQQAGTAITEVKAEVYRLAEQGLSSYQIAPLVGKSPATVQRWIKEQPHAAQGHEATASVPDAAAHEATDSAV